MSESTGSYPTWKQRHYREKMPNEALVQAILAVVPRNESIIDLGAGCGHFVKRLRDEGYDCFGVDGTPDVGRLSLHRVEWFDLVSDLPFPVDEWGSWDWALFSDVGEHVPREHEQALIDNVCEIPRKGIVVSWGYTGERGWHHVNCRPPAYVASEFARRGFWVDGKLTERALEASKASGLKKNYQSHVIRLFVATRRSEERCARRDDGTGNFFETDCGHRTSTADGIPKEGRFCTFCGRLVCEESIAALRTMYKVEWPC